MLGKFFILALLCMFMVSQAEKLDHLTFKGPFEETDPSGNRIAGSSWKSSGTTVVNKNFIRLTPDRQSKKGSLWSKRTIGVGSFSTVLQFRISGQGKNFFGDGIGLWLTQNSYHMDGPIHGSTDKFVGIGIIFDTFKNTENLAKHRDVTVLINNGDKTYELMTEDVIGCAAKIRYHSERADFSVTDSSRAKIVVEGKRLQVFMDANNSGEWESCVNIEDTQLPDYWANRAYIGISATTGALADNHDVLSLKTYSDLAVLEQDEVKDKAAQAFELPDGSFELKINTLGDSVNKLITRLDVTDHEVEHSLAQIQDHIKNLIGKINQREDKSEARIDNLEAVVKKEVGASLDERLTALELQMKGLVEKKMLNIESSLDRKMNRLQARTDEFGAQNAGSWKIPFLILAVLFLSGGVGAYLFYQKMLKMHLLQRMNGSLYMRMPPQ